jgi:TolB protein
MRWVPVTVLVGLASFACTGNDGNAPTATAPTTTTASPPTTAAAPATAAPERAERSGTTPIVVGEPIDVADLDGRIVFDDFDDVYTMRPDGSDVHTVTTLEGAEFDGAFSPDGSLVAYRDSRRGINEDDEIFVAGADGREPRNVTNDPANDWGPDWSPDGQWIAFNSDRDGGALRGYLVRPDGTDLTPLPVAIWFEYPSFSPDGTRIAFMSHAGGDYDIYVADLATGATTRLTDARGSDAWPAWSPDGSAIAFTSERDDCALAPDDHDCWRTGEPGDHHSVWLVDPDGTDERRVTPEHGQFVAWSPDGRHLLISGHHLYVVRPDGSGRVELRAEGFPLALGGIPDWTAGS